MDVLQAVKDKENYAEIVSWFSSLGDLDADQLVLLADTIGEMSEQIFEHYKALCDIMKRQLQRVRELCQREGALEAFPDVETRRKLAYTVEKACRLRAVLPEKYQELLLDLKDNT